MASTVRKQLIYGNHRITFLVLVDQGEGDLEELQSEGGLPLIGEASPIKESPILVEKLETNINIGISPEPNWHEIGEFADLGEVFSSVQQLKDQNTTLANHNHQLSRQLGVFESQQHGERGLG